MVLHLDSLGTRRYSMSLPWTRARDGELAGRRAAGEVDCVEGHWTSGALYLYQQRVSPGAPSARAGPHPPRARCAKQAVAARGLSLAATISWHMHVAQASTSTVGDLGHDIAPWPRARGGVAVVEAPEAPGPRARQLSTKANGRLVLLAAMPSGAVDALCKSSTRHRAGAPPGRGSAAAPRGDLPIVRTRCSPSSSAR